MTRLRIAILGCGKVTEALHLPVATEHRDTEVALLVDTNVARARELAAEWDVPRVSSDVHDAFDGIDAAIVALPNHLHAPVSVDLLEQGIHVLVEKPMALRVSDCDDMIAASTRGRATLAVGLVRRHYASSRFVKDAIEDGMLGSVSHVEMREGGVFGWKVASDFMFRKEAGGGVLADIGIHTLDLLLWWFGEVETVSYRDDAHGGVEADCELHLGLACGAVAEVQLSRLRRMRNTYRIVGSRGTLTIGNGSDPTVMLETTSGTRTLMGHVAGGARRDASLAAVFARQLGDFVRSIETRATPLVDGVEGARAVRLIESCRAVREPLTHRWSVDRVVPEARG